jgi:hypothetical protein
MQLDRSAVGGQDQRQHLTDDVKATTSVQRHQQVGHGRLVKGHRGDLLGVHLGRDTLSFTRWPLPAGRPEHRRRAHPGHPRLHPGVVRAAGRHRRGPARGPAARRGPGQRRDPLTLTLLFGISYSTAIRYCLELGPLDQQGVPVNRLRWMGEHSNHLFRCDTTTGDRLAVRVGRAFRLRQASTRR